MPTAPWTPSELVAGLGLVLRPLTAHDATAYHRVVAGNQAHLTQHGNYRDEVAASERDIAETFAEPGLRYGIWRGGELLGRVDLLPVDPPRYGFGFWLAEHATGHGYATAAGAALLAHAREALGATDVYAGVTHGNDKSAAVLRRLGFLPITEFADYTRFHCPLRPPARLTAPARPRRARAAPARASLTAPTSLTAPARQPDRAAPARSRSPT